MRTVQNCYASILSTGHPVVDLTIAAVLLHPWSCAALLFDMALTHGRCCVVCFDAFDDYSGLVL